MYYAFYVSIDAFLFCILYYSTLLIIIAYDTFKYLKECVPTIFKDFLPLLTF